MHAPSRSGRPWHRSSAVALVAVTVAGCGGASGSTTPAAPANQPTGARTATARTRAAKTRMITVRRTVRPRPQYPRVLGTALASTPTGFVPVATWHGQTAAWIARSASGVALLSFNQRFVELRLHSGATDAGSSGWRFGPNIVGAERHRLIAAFNGGFKFSTGAGGFMSYGRTAIPLRQGLGSIVTYSDGNTDIGSWSTEVPAAGRTVVSVRQNQPLLIDHGASSPSVACSSCWGATLGGVADPARSALGVTADGRLIWAGGEHLTATALADALLSAKVVRAVELDINPEWVAGYLYGHRARRGPLAPVPVAPGQTGIPGQFLAPWGRDFFAVQVR